jgi:hypothetical protein
MIAMKWAIDRIEEGIAMLVLQDDSRQRIEVPVAALPDGCSEGDILTLTFEKDLAATSAAKERVSGLLENLKKRL